MRLLLYSVAAVVFFCNVSVLYAATDEPAVAADDLPAESSTDEYQSYVKFFRQVFETMSKEYYHEVREEDFERFLVMFKEKIFSQLKGENKSSDYVKWRSAAYLVDSLRTQDDIFSSFMPPQVAVEYEQEVLGKRIDLGIKGRITKQGYLIEWVEPRSDAYEQGLRENDLVKKLASKDVRKLKAEEIEQLMTPLEGESVELKYVRSSDRKLYSIKPVSKEYFKQFVFWVPVDVPGVFCIRIERFNQMTPDDMTRFMAQVIQRNGYGLIIDLRGNPGGPPLAAQAISSFFLEPKAEFAYFQKRGMPKADLLVPEIPPFFHYRGDIVVLIDEKSGSASELFSGILQGRHRAELMGVNSAGQVFLKSMFFLEDESMLLLVTARGHHPDGTVFSFDGLRPDLPYQGDADRAVHYAALYLLQKRQKAFGGHL